MLQHNIEFILSEFPEILWGFADISYSPFYPKYKTALVLAVPYGEQLNLKTYSEQRFEDSIKAARAKIDVIIPKLEEALQKSGTSCYIPSVAQKNEEELLAEFSFKFAAVNAGLGWIGKNDVVITERYGPRVRLSAVLMDFEFPCGTPITESKCGDCRLCVDICPHKALKGDTWNIKPRRDEIIDYQLCNKKRSSFIPKLGRKSSCGLCLVVCPYGTE